MRSVLPRSILAVLDIDGDVMSQLLADNNIFRNAFEFLFDRDPKHTFMVFGEIGGVLMGAATQAAINSIVWVPDWTNPDIIVARVDPGARAIIAIMDRLTDDGPYYPQCWDAVATKLGITPSKVSEIRCVIDDRTSANAIVSAASVEATKLVAVSSAVRRTDHPEKAAKHTG